MEYMKMSKEEFINYVNELVKELNYDSWKALEDDFNKKRNNQSNTTFFDKLEEVSRSTKIDLESRKNLNLFKYSYVTFLEIDKFTLDVLNKEEKSIEEKERISNRILYMMNLRRKDEINVIIKVFSEEQKNVVKFLEELDQQYTRNVYNPRPKEEISSEEKTRYISLLKRVSIICDKDNDFTKSCIFIFDDLKIDHSLIQKAFSTINDLYVLSFNLTTSTIRSEIDFHELYTAGLYLKRFIEFDRYFDSLFSGSRIGDTSKAVLTHYSRLLEDYLNSNNRLEIFNKIIEKNKLTWSHFSTFLCSSDLKKYVHFNLIGYGIKDEDFKIKDIFTVKRFFDDYDLMIKRICYGSTYRDRFGQDDKKTINMSFKTRLFNKISPSNVFHYLTRGRKEVPTYELNFINKYTEEYSNYYKEMVKEKRSEEKMEKQEAIHPRTDVDDYIDELDKCMKSNYESLKKYRDDNDMSKEYFDKVLNIVRNERPNMYVKFIVHIASRLTKNIESGIKIESGKKRPFDIADYYEISPISPDKLNATLVNNGKSVGKTLTTFIKKYKYDCNIYKNDNVLNQVYGFCFDFDEKGKPLLDSKGRPILTEATEEDKLSALEYIIAHELPLTEFTCKSLVKRVMQDRINQSKKGNKKELSK